MVVNKVELCGVNTSKLPLLKEKEKEEPFSQDSSWGTSWRGKNTSKEIFGWCLV